ncbi:MAG: class I SAM-dependent methyltransferase [Angustibacter sp.]
MGVITRGTTHPNRLRRVDRWLTGPMAGVLRGAEPPWVVDLGFGASPITVVELRDRLRAVRADVQVVGLDLDPGRVAQAEPAAGPGLSFGRGGFEVPLPGGRRPVFVRALNVLRQYPQDDVEAAWTQVRERLAPGGVLVDGTCDELGRLAAWVTVDRERGPVTLTLSVRLRDLRAPSQVAARLPKVLIHRNTPGEPVHAFLTALDAAWLRHAGLSVYSARQRFMATVRAVRDAGWPIVGGPSRWRLGEVSVTWPAIAPAHPAAAPQG